MSQRAFGLEFVPTVRVGENLEIRKNDTEVQGYYEILYIEPLPFKVHDFGALASESSSGDAEVSDLYVNDKELACYELIPLDDMEITVSQPKAKKRYATKSYIHIITPFTYQLSPVKTRIWVFEDEKIYFDVKNPTKYKRWIHRALYHGWRFVLKELAAKPVHFTTVPIEGA